MCFVICSVNNSLVENVILSYNMGRRKTTVLHCIQNWINIFQKACRYKGIMSASESVGNNTQKKLIKIDISSDTVCPQCFVGKKTLDKAIATSKDHYDFEVCSLSLSLCVCTCMCTHVCVPTLIFYQLHLQIKWHPFQPNPSAPKEGINRKEYYRNKFGS